MKTAIRLIVALALLFTLSLTACSTVKVAYDKPQMQQAEQDAANAEAQVAPLQNQRDDLARQVNAKDAQLTELQNYKNQLQTTNGGGK
jgi:peptidoglycan hydrolase CwlO-like protein